MDWFEWKVEERAPVGDGGPEYALLLNERDDVLVVSGLIGVGQSIDAGERPGARIASVRHQVTCMMVSRCDVISST